MMNDENERLHYSSFIIQPSPFRMNRHWRARRLPLDFGLRFATKPGACRGEKEARA
jgi:hypothetical protein